MAATLAVSLTPRLLFVVLGLKPAGSLRSVLPSQSTPLTTIGESLDHVEVVLPPQVAEPIRLAPDQVGGPLLGDTSTPGTTTYLLTIGEDELNHLLWQRIFPDGSGSDRYRHLEIDLQPQGLVLYAEVDLGLRRPRLGLLLLQEEDGMRLSPAGVVLDQQLYGRPEGRSLAQVLLPTGRQAQRALRALTVVGPLPGEARAEVASFHHDRLQILARATYATPPPLDTGWQPLEPGVELREIEVVGDPERSAERFWIVRLNPAQVRFRVRYDPANPKTVSAWGRESEALLVVNGAYFAPASGDNEAIGLLVTDGQRWGIPLEDYAGMFAVTASGDVSVRWLRQRPYDPGEPLAEAVQSFPVLVKPGGVMGFPADADEGMPARRTVVAEDRNGNILLIIAPRGYLSLHAVAVYLARSDLAVDVALNLD
ncbi:MAG: phosphodiester glycosidase family protein, partial [Anaerolineae bacterium]